MNQTGFMSHWARRIDWPLMMAVGVLIVLGLLAVLSAVSPLGSPMRYALKQLLAVGIGVTILFILSGLNYQLLRSHPGVWYAFTVLLLAAVLVVGKRIHGAKSWIHMGPVSFEPVEVAKIGIILVVAGVLDRFEKIRDSSLVILPLVFALVGFHVILILMEPYLGGTLIYGPVLLGMLYFSGVRPLYLLAVVFYATVAGGIPIVSTYFSMQPQLLELHPVLQFVMAGTQGGRHTVELLFLTTSAIFTLWWLANQLYMRIPWRYPLFLALIAGLGVYSAHLAEHFVKDYQRKRILVFLSPGFDPMGAGYHILQSQIAVGSGRLFGKGLFSGTQSQLGFLPEQHTDFIFSVVGEEMGFLWAGIVLIAFGLLVWRAFVIATEAPDRFGALVASGIGCLFAVEAFINIGMVIGLMPVTGVPLPFMSYGGSHMVSSLAAVGILQSINFRRYIY